MGGTARLVSALDGSVARNGCSVWRLRRPLAGRRASGVKLLLGSEPVLEIVATGAREVDPVGAKRDLFEVQLDRLGSRVGGGVSVSVIAIV